MRFNRRHFAVLAFFSLNASALPGNTTTPQALGLNLALRPEEQSQLVVIENARVSKVEAFRSQAGRDHLRFQISTDGESYPAIKFNTSYTQATAQALEGGPVRLVGIWSSYRGEPSFTVMKVLAQAAVRPVAGNQATGNVPAGTLLRIDSAVITVASIEKYTSAAHKVHVLYNFKVGAKAYQGVLYDGDWTSKTLNVLRSGHATLYGTWSEYRSQPSFVTKRVAP